MKLITIDGPSASGKSSVSRLVAKELGWDWVSTGAFYRGLGLAARRAGLGESQPTALLELVESDLWQVQMTAENTQVFYQGQDVTMEIMGEAIGGIASKISQLPEIRQALLARQRRCFTAEQGLVAEGRDCGTVVFPQAPTKIYLTASPTLRALRRSEEEGADEQQTQVMQAMRDTQDSQRKVAPLKEANGALKIDSSFLSLEEVVSEVISFHCKQGFG